MQSLRDDTLDDPATCLQQSGGCGLDPLQVAHGLVLIEPRLRQRVEVLADGELLGVTEVFGVEERDELEDEPFASAKRGSSMWSA